MDGSHFPPPKRPRRRAKPAAAPLSQDPTLQAFGEGGGKGGGGGGRTPFEAENTLRSKASGQFMDVLSEGPILGLVDGLKSVFFNDTPLQNADGSFNFKGVNLVLMAGLPDQAVLAGFEDLTASPQTTGVGVQVKQSLGPVVRTVAKAQIHAVRVSIRVPALYKADKKSGDINPSQVAFQVDLKVDGGSYSTVLNETISGKNTAPFVRDYRIPLPPCATNWTLRVTRNTPDNDSDSALQNDLYWDAYTTLAEWPLSYPDTAYAAVGLDAELFGNQVPSRTYEIHGLTIKVPTNYDALNRVYSGVWDGTFKISWTNNPAWIFYDLLTNPRYGLGAAIPEATIDKWALYNIGVYCDQGVPDGNGGLEPRFSFNGVLNSLEDAYSALQSLAACFRGMIYYGAGVITATQDSPVGTPVKLVTNANVIDGVFAYEGSSMKSRHTVANVIFTDTGNNWRPAVEVVEADDGSLARWGHRPVDVQAVGVTSRSQARRIGKWLLDSERTATETVTYRAGLDHADLRPGDVIGISDRHYTGLRMGGRVSRADESAVWVDSPVTIVAGHVHKLRVTLADGTVAERDISNGPGAHTQLDLTVPLPQSNLPVAESVWQIDVPTADAASGTVAVRQFRVLQVAEMETAVFAVTALLHDETKYDRVELGLNRRPPVYSTALAGPIAPPSNPQVTEYLKGVGVTSLVRVDFSWTPSGDRRAKAYQVQAISGAQVIRNEVTDIIGFTFDDLSPGAYVFQVRALGGDALQSTSAWAATGSVNVDGKEDPPGKATVFTAVGGVRNVVVRWSNPEARYLRAVEVWAASSAAWSAASKVGESGTGQFIHTGLLPNTTWYYWLRAVDIFGQPDTVNQADFLGPVSATTSFLIASDIQDGIIETAKFASNIKPVLLIEDLTETAPDGTVAANKAEGGKLYRRSGGQWWPVVEALGPNATLTSEQIDGLNAAKLSGTLAAPRFPTNLRPVEVVSALPSSGNFLGRTVLLESDAKIYRWTSSASTTGTASWSSTVPAADVSGALAASNFPADLRPVERVAALPSTGNFHGRQVFLTTDSKVYRWTSSSVSTGTTHWTATTAAADIAGQLTNAQIAGIEAAKLTTQITGTQITDGAIATAKLDAGAVTAAKIFGGAVTTDKLDALAVTAGKLAAGAVETDKLAANAVTAGKILAGEISAGHIAAGTITADKMVMGDFSNRCDNPNFAHGAAGWVLTAGVSVIQNDAANAFLGHSYLRLATGATGIAARNGNWFPVTPGDQLYVRASCRAVNSPNANLTVRVRWHQADKSTVVTPVTGAAFPTTDTAWTTRGAALTVPAGAVWAFVDFLVGAALTTGEWRVGDVLCHRMNSAELIVDGAVTAGKIFAGAVQTDKLDAGAVTAAKIGAGEVTASKLAVVPQSLNPDPYFQDASAWAIDTGGWLLGNDPAFMGVPRHCYLSSVGGSYTAMTRKYALSAKRAPVTPGEKIALRARGRNTGNRSVFAQIIFYNSSNAYVGDLTLTWAAGEAASHKEAQGTVPANAVDMAWCAVVDTGVANWSGAAAISDIVVVRPSTASMIVDGSITTNKLDAGAVTAGKIFAGAVTAEKLSVGPASGNAIWNSCFRHNASGWASGGTAPPTSWGACGNGQPNDPGATYTLAGHGTGYMYRSVVGAGAYMDVFWLAGGGKIPIEGGKYYEFSAAVQAHGCNLRLVLIWYNGADQHVGEQTVVEVSQVGAGAGTALNEYTWAWGKAQAPANASRCMPCFRMVGLGSGAQATASNPYGFFTQIQVCPANAYQTERTPYAPGGITSVDGGMIRSNAILADHILAGEIKAGKLATDAVTAGTIAAGAVKAREIDAYAIKGTHIAAETILTQTLQVQDLIIGTSKISNDGASGITFQNLWQANPQMGSVPGGGALYLHLADVTIVVEAASNGRTLVQWHADGGYIQEPQSGSTNYSDPGY